MNINLKRGLAAASTLALGAAFVIGSASTVSATETWTITSLSTPALLAVDVDEFAGDDGGFLAPTQEGIILNNDNSGYFFSLTDLAPISATDSGYDESNISQVSDLKANVAYELHVSDNTDGILDNMTKLDQQGNLTDEVIDITPSIDVNSSEWFLMSGFGYFLLWDYDNGVLYSITPDGTATLLEDGGANTSGDFTPAPATNDEGSNWFMSAGVAEFDGTDYWYVGVDLNAGISEFNITGAAETNELAVNSGGDGDSDTFNISTCSNKWYNHTEDGYVDYFGLNTDGNSETVIAGDAVFSSAGECPSSSDPELPDTGVDVGAGVALAAALAALGAAAFIVVRRRQVASK